ncbi:hypothetical protein [Salinigranum halophilum]|uniref:hypothetical protein n=1 Tax=Salinigranum halophilum TaxID=2565931 RepID=UPI0010A762DC|nr:hypothetical protein [Salinigranum halophilum]
MTDRARITITDVVYLLLAVFALAAFYPALQSVMAPLAPRLPVGQQLVLTTILPLAVLVILGVTYSEAMEGLR